MNFMKRTFHVLIEQDEDGVYVGKVPELAGCLTQGDSLDELMKNIKEAIELCLEVQTEDKKRATEDQTRFVGVQEIEV
ncbi:MAG TPA: type II toxin-antitoxin system HicB family antitoxin [Candidatus Nanoarchaeia archaeon]|nr:type II toxin-antitoxin system HicB family antitoxin [Candidatus Nanoarchaeia archaeon]